MADGIFYNDLKEPILTANIAAVTLLSTDKALVPAANMPVLGSRYFDRVGKRIRIRVAGVITTAATPGNGSFTLYWGSGADATGASLGVSNVQALVAGQTNATWIAEFEVECRATGASGTLMATGWALFSEAVSVAHMVYPATGAGAVAADLTAASTISIQFKRSGSTVETMQVVSLDVIALN